MALQTDFLAMVLFLTVASIANLKFLAVAAKDRKDKRTDAASSRALLGLGVAEMCWIVPCWLQCLVSLFSEPDAHVNAAQQSWGCNLMGTYSVFASVPGIILSSLMAYLSYCHVVKGRPATTQLVTNTIMVAFGLGVAFTAAIVIIDGGFTFSGAGYCYIDFGSVWQAVVMEAICYPCVLCALYWFAAAACARAPPSGVASSSDSDDNGKDLVASETSRQPLPEGRWWWLFALSFGTAWMWWLPAPIIVEMSELPYPASMPGGYMITAGFFGHGQALLNPLLYGLLWRKWFLYDRHAQLDMQAKGDSPA